MPEHWMQNRAPFERSQPRSGRGRGPSPQLPCRATDEDIIRRRIEHPVVTLPRIVVMPRHFDETLVQAQVVADRVLPALLVLFVIREVLHDVLVDAVQRESFFRAASYRHHDECVVAVGGFFAFLLIWCGGRAGRRGLRAGDIELGVRG